MNICIWKTYHLNDATLLFGSKWKRIHNWDFPKMGFLWKTILVTFYCCFFQFFSKNCQKVKVTNLTKNDQNYQILLETCFLRSLVTIWWIFYHSIVLMSFWDMGNWVHKLKIWAKNSSKKWPKFFFIKISFLGNLSCGFFSILSQITK